jgi:BirA family biotin operon repressor/biotin-[acetyl-CoA-carboxylase] ligase
VTETGSTNADVAEAAAGEPEGLVIVADHQTAGRGRLGRTWVAPSGSALLMSVLLRPPDGTSHLAVATVACAAAAAVDASIKWPNDLLADDGRKLAGILAEAVSGNMTAIVVGLGLNLWTPPDFPEELRTVATSLGQRGADIPSRDEVLGAVLTELELRYRVLCDDGPAELMAEYRRRCVTVGQRVRIEQLNGTWEGTAVGIDGDGALLVDRERAGTVRVEAGDVVHLRRT